MAIEHERISCNIGVETLCIFKADRYVFFSFQKSQNSMTDKTEETSPRKDPLAETTALLTTLVNIPDPSTIFTASGLTALVIAPFFQGMFYGLGEGFSKVIIGRWVGLDMYTSLGVKRRPANA